MQIKDLTPKQGNVDIVVKVVEVGAPREFSKFGRAGRVANATVKDETGEVKLTLWNDQIEKVKAGDTVRITNGYVNEWQGEMQLTSGRNGTIEVVESGGEVEEKAASPKEESDEPSEPEDYEEKDFEEEELE